MTSPATPPAPAPGSPAPAPAPPNPAALLRSRAYVRLLVLAGLIGLPISALAFGFLKLVAVLEKALFTSIPKDLGFTSVPVWWPLPVLALGGLLTALAIQRLPGTGGHSPADGFKTTGPLPPIDLPGVFLAALATLSFGAVLGPEAPLIAIGSGLGVLAVKLTAKDAPPSAAAVIAAAGSFAAIASLLGSPLAAAFLLLEVAGLSGPMVGLVMVPGLLSAGLGTLIFLGLGSITGFGTFSLAIPDVPAFGSVTVGMLGWAVVLGLAGPFLGKGISWLAVAVRSRVEGRTLVFMPVLGVLIAGLAIGFDQATSKGTSEVLFSGQSALPGLVEQAGTWSVGALLLLIAAKSLAYGLSLSSFRGGPVFPSMYIGAAVGVAASHLPGLPLAPAVAMGIGVMTATMLKLPLTAVLLATLLIGSEGVKTMPLVIVAVVVSFVVTTRLTPMPEPAPPTPAPPVGG